MSSATAHLSSGGNSHQNHKPCKPVNELHPDNSADLSVPLEDHLEQKSPLYFTLDSAGIVLAVSPRVAASLGHNPDCLVGQSIINLVHSADQAALQTGLRTGFLEDSPPWQAELRLLDRDGKSRLRQLTVQVLHGSEAKVAFLLTCTAIPARSPQLATVDTQLQLAFEFEATLKRITDKVRDSLEEDQILETAVHELVRTIGVTCCNASLYDLEKGTSTIHYEYTIAASPYRGRIVQLDAFPEIYGQLLHGQAFQFCSLIHNPMRGRSAMLTCPIVNDQGVLGDLWLINQAAYGFSEQDIRLVQQVANQCAIAIRQARLYQAAQAQVEELERLSRLKDDFLSTISHELRTPIASIKMAAQMLEVTLKQMGVLPEAGNQRVMQYFQILQSECQRQISLISDLLDLSRLDPKPSLKIARINLPQWLESVVRPFIEQAKHDHQQFRLHLPPTLPTVTTDPACLERICSELLHNACKYTPAGETITVTAQLQAEPPAASRIPGSKPTPSILLSITNSGVEIPASELSRIFEKFYRIPNQDPWQHGGTGLGLALVKKLADRLGAMIRVESIHGETCFTLELPLSF